MTLIRFCDRFRRFVLPSLLVLGFFIASPSWSKVEYDSTSLQLKNSDQVTQMITGKIKKAQKLQAKQEDDEDGGLQAEPEALENLKDGLRIALSRPDQPEGARKNLYTLVRRELIDIGALDQILVELTEESLGELRKQEGPRRTATYVVILENLMAEIRPEIGDNSAYRKIVERIRDAKITITQETKVKNLLRSMSVPASPSVTAGNILNLVPSVPQGQKKKK